MTPEERIVLAAFDAVNSGSPDRIGELVAADLVEHGAALSGLRYEIHDLFSAGDRVALRATAYGTRDERPLATMHICRVDGGRVVEHWSIRDAGG